MNDRESLLRAIDREPGNRLAKLVYADWLEEYGTTEAEAATVEWLRLTNHAWNLTKAGNWKPEHRYWLEMHWERLVATARSLHKVDPTLPTEQAKREATSAEWLRMEAAYEEWGRDREEKRSSFQVHNWRTNRHLVTHWNLAPPGWNDATPRFYSYRVNIHFGNGFVTAFEAVNQHAQAKLNELIIRDQPLCRIPNLIRRYNCQCGMQHEIVGSEVSEYRFRETCTYVRVRQNVYEPRVTPRPPQQEPLPGEGPDPEALDATSACSAHAEGTGR